ncbi:MAG: serine--tRNA ligase, partial [Thermoproteota archaeon]
MDVGMDFLLKGWLKFNRNLDEGDVAVLVDIISRKVPEQFSKGVPRGKKGSRIVNWKVEGDKLKIEIEGTRYLRPHDAILRLKNLLLAELSKRRLGVRDVRIEEYRIRTDVRANASEVREIFGDYAEIVEKEPLTIAFRGLKEEDIKSRMIDRALAELMKVVEEVTVPEGNLVPVGTVLMKTSQKPYATEDGAPIDPSTLALKKGWIKRFPGRGQWVLTSPMARLLRVLKEMIEDHILIPLGFQEWMFPKLIPWDVYERMPGYFEHLAEGLMYVCHAGRDPEALKEFKLEVRLKKKADPSLARRELEGPTHVLAAAQCEPFYQFFSGEIAPEEILPVKVYDASGWTYRWEGGGVEGLL